MEKRILGRTRLEVGRLGMAASFGVPAAAVERAFERGVNYLYWGTFRRGPFGQALRNLKLRRDRMVVISRPTKAEPGRRKNCSCDSDDTQYRHHRPR